MGAWKIQWTADIGTFSPTELEMYCKIRQGPGQWTEERVQIPATLDSVFVMFRLCHE